MKKLFLLIAAVSILWSCSNDPSKKVKQENLQKAQEQLAKMDKFPEMKFDYTEVDFGTHREGEILDTVFTFTNVGDAPLIISKVKTSCGCTVSEWPKEPVQPGEKGRIAVSFDTHHKTGKQVKSITIHSNEKQLTRTLKVKAQIIPQDDKTAQINNPRKDLVKLPAKHNVLMDQMK